ncbi:glutaminyl-tRNA synthase (glutamine-hydrolyzing) subunit B [Candidatus Falkowbacteria bacterium RIFOXYA2_FULL_47_19]|uniref:Aspartyl/glutamyl-tRNA(Asn/Gln) amidotransferase subunit B n=1 Tax=Candidatus Falkowbacteria bacterium RIFOXYA2_FULL_47_19 TaxID=1797994 RepID=A0A1F5SL06_9BACT|nr:MAG: glutaminyl-tRNA synthase (glutamine-hydrolyzing) subunit B [Candidatus Falkowbacteria bacterium RIFOXYA2_FULL_47_19]
MEYDVIIGLEIHAELKTKSKMFCACDNDAEGKAPNTTVCPICMGHPGTLPSPNKQAIEWTILTGLALNCKIHDKSKFDRKNYFYPDLPKGYQISQYDLPFCYEGYLELDGNKVAITRIHLEEDTGKLTHPQGKNHSLVDFNRAGTPLMEMVTEPVIRDAATAKKFCQTFREILRYLDISDADMEKGQMRCEANVSLQARGSWKHENGQILPIGDHKLNPKVEVKNINSFRAVEKAINYEIKRQTEALTIDEEIVQETRGWDENRSVTVRQRIKESSADYRYFPEPDIPPINITPEMILKIRSALIELPPAKKIRFMEQYSLDAEAAEILTSDKNLAAYAENVISELREWIGANGDNWERQRKKLSKAASNWLVGELFMHLKKDNLTIKDVKITPENFAELITLVFQDKINSSVAQKILAIMYKKGGDPTNIMSDLGLEQLDDETELESIVASVLAENPTQVDEYRAGKTNILQFLVGKTMAATKGKANPKKAAEIIKRLLK